MTDDYSPAIGRRALLAALSAVSPLAALIRRPQARPSRVDVVDAGEPGTRIRISCTIYKQDGRTAAPDTKMFLYHTDAAVFTVIR